MLPSRPRLSLLAALLLVGCRADDVADDGPPSPTDVSDATDAQTLECAHAIDRAEAECPASFTLSIVDHDDDPGHPPLEVVDLERVARAVPGGIYVPASPSLPGEAPLGLVFADNDTCQVSCTIACDVSRNDLCASSQADGPSCSFCGAPASADQCAAFVAACE